MRTSLLAFALAAFLVPACAHAADTGGSCGALPNHDALQTALAQARGMDNGGLNLDMWGAVVARDGTVCALAYTGKTEDAQWPGSRLIAAQKAYTANAFSLKGNAISTANLYGATQPGAPLFGLQASNPINTNVAYEGPATTYGTGGDPLVGKVLGGINVFGGGFALYDQAGDIVGGIGVSGDTSCADNNIGWRARNILKLDYVPGGVAKDHTDAIIYDYTLGKSASGYGHPTCGNKEDKVAKQLPKVERAAP